jgi:hypothetical protein
MIERWKIKLYIGMTVVGALSLYAMVMYLAWSAR